MMIQMINSVCPQHFHLLFDKILFDEIFSFLSNMTETLLKYIIAFLVCPKCQFVNETMLTLLTAFIKSYFNLNTIKFVLYRARLSNL